MKFNIYSILLASASLLTLAGCDKETNFLPNTKEGQLKCGNLSVKYVNDGTRANNVDTGDFTVNFVNTATEEVVKSYTYSSMPEVVSLPVGDYRAEAIYGDNPVAEWDNPFYKGSSNFSIEAGKLTDNVDPIECTLRNIKVQVEILDETGMNIIGNDVQVVVKAGKEGELTYDSDHINRTGFFRYDEGSTTIIAELYGTLDDFKINKGEGITRIYEDAAEGMAYRIRFHVNRPDNVNDGDIQLGDGIKVDATIQIKDENHIINPGEPADEIQEDNMRPVEGTGKDPNKDPNDDPTPKGKAPEIVPMEGMTVNECFTLSTDSEVKFSVTSETGITAFDIVIESTTLTPEELSGVGLTDKLDLVNPGEYEEALNGLGFPTGAKVKDQKYCEFDISTFVPLIFVLGPGEHKFHMTISNAAGTTEGTIWLKNE